VLPICHYAQDRKKNALEPSVVLEIIPPAFESVDKNSPEVLTYYLKIASVIADKNREKPFDSLPNQARMKIARWLNAASEIEKQDCYKKYLSGLAKNVLEQGRLSVDLPLWSTLEQDQVEIIFPRADRYSAALLVLETFFNIPAGNYLWGKGNFFDAVVFLNNPDLTGKYKEYTAIFPLMQDHLYSLSTLANMRQEISYSPVIPSFKIAQLIFTSQTEIKGGSLVFPDIDFSGQTSSQDRIPNEDENTFKIIVFKNTVESYFEGILKPISASILTGEQMWGLDSEIYLSNLIMRRIAHHLGPVFVIAAKDDTATKSAKVSFKKEQKNIPGMQLKIVSESLGNLFPLVEAIKSQAIAIYNTPVLINSGLLSNDKAADVYLTYLVSLVDNLRDTPREMNAGQPAGKKNWEELIGDPGKENYLSALIQFNYLLAEDGIILNIGSHTLDIKQEKFVEAVGKLTGEVIRLMTYPNYDTVRWFIERNSTLAPELKEILKSVESIPSRVEFYLEKPTLIKEKEEARLNNLEKIN
jgi:hypothetical protein